MLKKINNIGDSGIVCDFGKDVNQSINNDVIKLFYYIKKQANLGNLKGILNCIPSYNKLTINFDLKITNTKKVCDFINSVNFSNLNINKDKKEWSIPICYDLELDLFNISKKL